LFVEHKRRVCKRRVCKQRQRFVWKQQWKCGECVDYFNQRWQLFGFLLASHQLWPRRWRRNGCSARTRFDFERCGIDSRRRIDRNHGSTPLPPREE
jgi:hypothetical protein